MTKIRNMFKILRQTGIDILLGGYVLLVLVCALLLILVEPNFNSLLDGLWYSVVTITSVGFGDIVPVTAFGKIISMVLMLSGVIIIALFTGTLVHYYQTLNDVRRKDEIMNLLDELENLPNLKEEELIRLSKKIKKIRLER